jgi:hypothetical protein
MNSKLKRGDQMEANVPIFLDSKTRIRFPNLYQHKTDFKDGCYKLEEKSIIEFKKLFPSEVKLFLKKITSSF